MSDGAAPPSSMSELADYRHRMRHSAAHIMADIVRRLFPEAKLAIGPPTEDGFYYDFLVSRPFTPEDVAAIEAQMREVVAQGVAFQRQEVSRGEAKALFAQEPFKQEIIDGIPPGEAISIYRHGAFVDLCEGPHVTSTSEVKALKLLEVAGAYWRGDEHNPMLQRIYGTAFESQEALDEHLERLEEARRRDHRRLGRELDLFLFDPIAPASPFFLPKGAIVYNLLIQYVRGLYDRYGYQEVITPQIFSTELWKRSGHYEAYRENMYFTTVDDREYGVKPMNCPGHALMYASRLRSYRDLPVRYADFGRLHRYERSGVTHGLTRVRTFSQDDAHIFCRPDQIHQEVKSFAGMVEEAYRLFQFPKPRVALSLRPDPRVGTDAMWDRAEAALEEVLQALELTYERKPGEGAFYGPKVDFFIADALGREWQLGTVQLDFSLPERFDLEYIGDDGSPQRPVVIHRAMLGSLERFLGVLIEHYGGAFPVWLAPVQAVLIPIADRHGEYAQQVAQALKARGLRVQVDDRNERMNAKIRDAQLQKTPYMLVAGDREAAEGNAAVRLRSGENLGPRPVAEVIDLMLEAVAARR
ncbi:MAG: threonine--tRNA ligase [Dehalococcoidia bacterium]|nr:threonine--tRNA ligase [Dehalococcoidia bacterium]